MKGPQTFWDAAFLLGLVTQATKLLDWILRPKQQKWVANVFDSIALRLHYAKPLTWFRAFGVPRVQVILIVVASAYLLIQDLTSLTNAITHFQDDQVVADLTFYASYILGIGFAVLVMLRWGVRLFRWIYGEGNFGTFFWRWLSVEISSSLGLAMMFGIFLAWFCVLAASNLPSLLWQILAVGLVFWMTATIALIWTVGMISLSGFLVIAVQLALVLLSLLIAPLRFIVWRVVEFNKGPVAALSLLTTVACGAIAGYLHLNG